AMRRTFFALLLALALAGCAGPRPSAPPESALDAPAAWRTAPASGAVVEATWWQAFGDPVLSLVVEKALQHNVDVAFAAQRVEEARAQFRLADAQLTPTVTAVAEGERTRGLNAFGRPVTQNLGRVGLDLSYEVDLFGRLATASAAAKASLLATE